MQTRFSKKQLQNPKIAKAEKIIRNCVHCGFCLATCPTYVIEANELDSPRGRIYLIKEMLENDRAATKIEAEHIDKCLSCLSCVTTCPSAVDYMHLVDDARVHIEETYKRPFFEHILRRFLAFSMPRPLFFKGFLMAGNIAKPFASFLPRQLEAMLELMPKASKVKTKNLSPVQGKKQYRMGLHAGCVQRAVGEHINIATAEFLTRRGVELVIPQHSGCCGALSHHLGYEKDAMAMARAYIDSWKDDIDNLDAIVINTSGCGVSIKDYGTLLEDDPKYAAPARRISALAKDITEVIGEIGLGTVTLSEEIAVAYHPPCSLQHGQKIINLPKQLLIEAGFLVCDIKESHLCCGSAGTYNITQPQMATKLKNRKIANIEKTNAAMIASGNLGCIIQIASGTDMPVFHTIELLNWATGGKKPEI